MGKGKNNRRRGGAIREGNQMRLGTIFFVMHVCNKVCMFSCLMFRVSMCFRARSMQRSAKLTALSLSILCHDMTLISCFLCKSHTQINYLCYLVHAQFRCSSESTIKHADSANFKVGQLSRHTQHCARVPNICTGCVAIMSTSLLFLWIGGKNVFSSSLF